jgi:hypothetical protein
MPNNGDGTNNLVACVCQPNPILVRAEGSNEFRKPIRYICFECLVVAIFFRVCDAVKMSQISYITWSKMTA